MTMPDWMFKQLDAQEEETFRKWARDHWEPHKEPDPAWHPVVKDEWKKEQDRYSEYVAAKMAGELD
jgi:hypothetical protein